MCGRLDEWAARAGSPAAVHGRIGPDFRTASERLEFTAEPRAAGPAACCSQLGSADSLTAESRLTTGPWLLAPGPGLRGSLRRRLVSATVCARSMHNAMPVFPDRAAVPVGVQSVPPSTRSGATWLRFGSDGCARLFARRLRRAPARHAWRHGGDAERVLARIRLAVCEGQLALVDSRRQLPRPGGRGARAHCGAEFEGSPGSGCRDRSACRARFR